MNDSSCNSADEGEGDGLPLLTTAGRRAAETAALVLGGQLLGANPNGAAGETGDGAAARSSDRLLSSEICESPWGPIPRRDRIGTGDLSELHLGWAAFPAPVPRKGQGAPLVLNPVLSPRALQTGKAEFRPVLIRHGSPGAGYVYPSQGRQPDSPVVFGGSALAQEIS